MADTDAESVQPDPSAISTHEEKTANANNSAANEANAVVKEIEKEEAPQKSNKDSSLKVEDPDISHGTKDENQEAQKNAVEPAPLSKAEKVGGLQEDGRKEDDHQIGNRRNSHYQNKKGGKFHQRPYQDYRENVKSDLTSQKESSDPAAIRKQVEFYFSDSNLPMDKFLVSKVEGHKNLPVPISVVHSFKRMRHFQPFSAIAAALKESTYLDVVDNDTAIQRKVPLAEDLTDKPIYEVRKVFEDAAMARSVYVKGFGQETPSTQFDIEAFFAEYGPTNSVRLRRDVTKTFKGSVFVEYDSEATQKAFLALESKPAWKGKELLIKSKKQYCDEKVGDITAGRIRRNSPRGNGRENGKSDRRANGNRDWRERRDEDRKSGFKDERRGGRKGFGSAGRGRGGGGRGGKGHRDRNEEKREEKQKDERGVPKIATPEGMVTANPINTSPKAQSTAPSASSEEKPQKRPREDEGNENVIDQGKAKKIDVKTEPPVAPGVDSGETVSKSGTEISKKRSREGDDDDDPQERNPAKKVSLKGAGS